MIRILLQASTVIVAISTVAIGQDSPKLLKTEKLDGDGVWVMPILKRQRFARPTPVKVWFEDQFLGDGKAYKRRSQEFASWKRTELRAAVMRTLKDLNAKSFAAAKADIDRLVKEKKVRRVRRHWIVNGFSCTVTKEGFEELKKVPGVRKIFFDMGATQPVRRGGPAESYKESKTAKFDPARYQHPWYSRYLLADKVWREFAVTGKGTLNIIHDFNFVFPKNLRANLHRNTAEVPGNGKDDDGNGHVDDFHGFNFDANTAGLTTVPVRGNAGLQALHGTMCAAIICGVGQTGSPRELGIAPQASWAGVIASRRLETAVEWAVEQKADTYSMSFSIPGLGHYRSHWRKVMEHGSYCGIYFVSGAGNFAQRVPVPVQMRIPEDIPEVVFAAAGVQRNFARTPFSSKGPVKWQLEHYNDGTVQKPEVCAFNSNIPRILPDGKALPGGASGNSFAGPMFCGSIALMLSADKELLPWDLKTIITSTATDVAAPGVDYETGHGLINCYRAVKEVLRRKAKREGKDAARFTGRVDGDTLDIQAIKRKLQKPRYGVSALQAGGQAGKLGVKAGDVILRYNGLSVANRRQMQAAKRRANQDKVNPIPVVILRGGKEIEFKFAPGPLGLIPQIAFDDPVFK